MTRREAVTVHGYPALLDHDPGHHCLEVTWREPGGIELTVHAKEDLGHRSTMAAGHQRTTDPEVMIGSTASPCIETTSLLYC